MHDEKRPPRRSRRAALRFLGAGVLTATAGCQFANNSDDSTDNTSETRRRSSEKSSTNDGEPTGSSAPQEHSIITGSPAATASPTVATTTGTTTTSNPTETTGTTTSGTSPPTNTTASPEPTTVSTTTESASTPAEASATEPTRTTTETETPTATATTTEPTTIGTPTTETPPPTATETPSNGSTGEWAEKAPLPVVGSDAGGGVLDGKLHFFGGIETAVELDAVSRAFAYDPSAGSDGSWERLPDFPRALWGPCGVATDDAIYSFGGAPQNSPYEAGPPTDLVFRYRPDDGWTNLTESEGVRCPYPNWVMGGVYNPDDGLIYCVGGGTGDHDAPTASDHGFHGEDVPGTYDESRLWTFDPETERVANGDLARMPNPKRWPTVALFEVDGKRYLHAIAGLLGTTGPTDSNFRYDIGNGGWERAHPTPRPGTYATHSNPVIEGRAYLTHGMFWHGRSTIDRYKLIAHRYDPVTDGFVTDLPTPSHRRGGSVSGVIDGTLYVAGGHLKRFEENDLHDCVAYNEAYTPASE